VQYILAYIYFNLKPVQFQFRPDLASSPATPCASVQSCRRSATATSLDHKSPVLRGVRIIGHVGERVGPTEVEGVKMMGVKT